MNELQYLLVVLSEECTEVMQDIINKKNFNDELNDLISVAEMYAYNRYGYCDLAPEEIKVLSVENLNKELLNLQYYISKSLRFGLDDHHPITKEINSVEINKSIITIRNSLAHNYNKEKIEAKKIKVRTFMVYSMESGNLIPKSSSELKEIASTSNYYIQSWVGNGWCSEVYRADIRDEEDDDTWELFSGTSELDVVQQAYNWMKEQELMLSKTGQDYKTLHKDDNE